MMKAVLLCLAAIAVFAAAADDEPTIFIPAALPCDHTVKYERYSIGGGKRVLVKGKFAVKGRFIMREQEWGEDVEDYLIARSDIQREGQNTTFEVFYALRMENGTRICQSQGMMMYPSLLNRFFADYMLLRNNLTYTNVRPGRFEQKDCTVYTSNGYDFYVDDDDRIIGLVRGTNTTQFWYSRGASMGNFKLSKKFEGCNETRIYESAVSDWVLCAASVSKAAIAAVLAVIAAALVSLF